MVSPVTSKIIYTTDFSDCAERALPYAVGLARRHEAELIVLHVMPPFSVYLHGLDFDSYEEAVQRESKSRLEILNLGNTTGVRVRREIIADATSAAAGITEYAAREKADLIVMSSHGHRVLAQLILGSVARRVIATSSCPVFCVTRDDSEILDSEWQEIDVKRILVPTDLSEASKEALRAAVDHARIYGASIDLLYILHMDVPPMFLPREEASILAVGGEMHPRVIHRLEGFVRSVESEDIEIRLAVEEGSPAKKIAFFAETHDSDMIVLSRRGLGDTPHLLGGVAERLLHEAPCPMIVV